jgi:AcrR family transcriptional regulator
MGSKGGRGRAGRAGAQLRRHPAGGGVARRGSYHHGDLRRALIDGALRILETQGVSALTLRAAARRAGVSQAAPYRHFADKEDLLAAVAAEGFRALSAAMREAADRAGGEILARFLAIGMTYIRFAVSQPARFRLMFGGQVADREAHLPLRQAAEETFGLLIAGIEEGQKAGVIRDGDQRELSMVAWSAVHGLSALVVDGQLPRGNQDPELVASGVLRDLFLGLRRDPPG